MFKKNIYNRYDCTISYDHIVINYYTSLHHFLFRRLWLKVRKRWQFWMTHKMTHIRSSDHHHVNHKSPSDMSWHSSVSHHVT